MALHLKVGTMVWRLLGKTHRIALKKVLGCTHATLENLRTKIMEVEAVLNN